MISIDEDESKSKRGGFTLVETVLALAIVTTGLLAIIAAAGTSLDRLSSLSTKNAALRLQPTLVDSLRNPEEFPQLYEAMRNGTPIYAYCVGGSFEGENRNFEASDATAFELAEHHSNRIRISSDERFTSEVSACPFLFRLQFSFYDLNTGEEIKPSELLEDFNTLASLRLPVVIDFYWASAERVLNGYDATTGRPVTTLNTVLKP